ncbi:MAG: APC family permease [Cyanobacteriota bacterium]|nr:APC family permease [Cyanobacteriota bacterium]
MPSSGGDNRPLPVPLSGHLGLVAVTTQAVATIGLTLTAVINIPQAAATAGRATWICYAVALVLIVLVTETLVLFRRSPGSPSGIAGYVEVGLGPRLGAVAAWALLLGYSGAMLACLVFFGSYLNHLIGMVGWPTVPLLGYAIGGLACLELARRDVEFSTRTMLTTEAISVVIVLGLCLLVLRHGGPQADLAALDPVGDSAAQIRSGLMVAVLSFIGFESAATLGGETRDPGRVVPQAMRIGVALAGVLFLIWAVVLSEGLAWLTPAERASLEPIALLADRLGQQGAGTWIKAGAFLCLFGSTLGSLNALGRIGFHLARRGVLPPGLGVVHPRFGTPARALLSCTVPLLLIGGTLELMGRTPDQLFDALGGFAVLAFLLVYGLVALAALLTPLPGSGRGRRRGVASASLVAVSAVAIAYTVSVLGHQDLMLLAFLGLMLAGLLLVAAAFRRSAPPPAAPR